MYYFPEQPPYLLLVIGFLVALTSGLAFSSTLKLTVQKWVNDSQTDEKATEISTKSLRFPFLGITLGIGVFLASGLEIFGFPPILANSVAIALTLFTCILVWKQLGSMLTFAQNQGFKALDLDIMN